MWHRPERRSETSLAARGWYVAKGDAGAREAELAAESKRRFPRAGRVRELEAALAQAREVERSWLEDLGASSVTH